MGNARFGEVEPPGEPKDATVRAGDCFVATLLAMTLGRDDL